MGLDFEGVLKYFRVTLPKKYRTDEAATELIQLAMSMKVSVFCVLKLLCSFLI